MDYIYGPEHMIVTSLLLGLVTMAIASRHHGEIDSKFSMIT